MLLGIINLMPGVRYRLLIGLWTNFIAFNCQVVEFPSLLTLFLKIQVPVVRKVDNAIHRINHYPVDSVVCFVNTYPLDSDLSGG